MIPAFFKTDLIKRLALFFCLVCSAGAGAAPILIGTDVHESLYQWLDQQPELNSASSLTITPSGSFMSMGSQLFYAPGVDLNNRLKESAWAAAFEVSHTLLLSLVLKLALWMNPVVPVYLPVSFGVDWYRFLRLWRSRLLLAWQLASWGMNTASEAIWPTKEQITLDLSSPETGVVIGELDMPVDKSQPIELNIYTAGESGGEFSGCDSLTTFDCLINSFRAVGVHRWKLQWMHDTYEVDQWFYRAEEEPLAVPSTLIEGIFNQTVQKDGLAHDVAGIFSALFSETFLKSNLEIFHHSNPVADEVVTKDWSGNHSAFVPLGCHSARNCPGLLIAEGMTSESVSVKRVILDADAVPSEFLEPFDNQQTGVVLNRSSRLYRIPESVITVAFEILEELIEELGYQAVEALAASSADLPEQPVQDRQDMALPEQPVEETGEFMSGRYDTEPLEDSHDKRDFLEAFEDLIEGGYTVSIPRLETLADILDMENIKNGYKRAVWLNHLEMAEVLFKRLPEDWVRLHLKHVIRRPSLMGLKKIVQFLPEHYLLFAMMEAANYGHLGAIKTLNFFASEATRDSVIIHAAHRGRTDIVRAIIPGRSQGILRLALNQAHYSGYPLTQDLILDHLEATTIKSMLKVDILKEHLVRALENDQMERVKRLVNLAPQELRDALPALLAKHSRMHSKNYYEAYVASKVPDDLLSHNIIEDEALFLLRIARGMTDFGRDELLKELVAENKQSMLPVVFGTFSSADRKVTYLLSLAETGDTGSLEVLMAGADPVTRDQVLLESVRTMRAQPVIVELARRSDMPSIKRAAIYAAKTGLPVEAKILEEFLPYEPPIYHLNEEQKALQKEELRRARNHRLGRQELGEKFYIYMHQGNPARMLYIIAHGNELPGQKRFKHTGNYQLGFMAPDGHNLRTNHIEAFLEDCFVPKEIMAPGQEVKEYGLEKNYNSGWAFKAMHGDCGKHNEDLMEKKAAPAVIFEMRKHFAATGKSVDFLMVRGKEKVMLSSLLHELNQAEWATYNQVVVGCCRGGGKKSPVYKLPIPLTTQYLSHAPELFMKVANYLKVHPAFWDSPVWEFYHPDTAPEIWLNSLEYHQDRMVSYARRKFKDAAERTRKNTANSRSAVARH